MVDRRLMIHRGIMIHRRLVRRGGMMRGRLVVRCRSVMVVVIRAAVGVVAGRAVRRHAHMVHMGRIMPGSVIPGGRTPVRHKAGCRDGGNGEDGGTGSGVAIHGAAVVVAENREAVRIVAGVGPGDGGAHIRATHTDGGTGVYRVVIHRAAAQHERCAGQHGDVSRFLVHGMKIVVCYNLSAS